ncbi:MAG: hypothetical protein GF418_12415 [Chitinivibrionales bacterium]|nr:hypothetical protein [Chitinivibrionales bacterium]MBD3396423.1 hypothetical protein [Chitinivibrionales bacterium]
MMKVSLTKGIFAGLGLAMLATAAEMPKMYLCADTTSPDTAKEKLVYGYIDGKKTECMSEYEFLALYGTAQFDKDSVARDRARKKAMAEAKVAAPVDDAVARIKSGDKDFEAADLMGADLSKLDLSGAVLKSADLRNANLSGADLSGADLTAAFCRKTNLKGADLSGANLTGTYLSEADLRGAKGLTVDRLKEAKTFYRARLDAEVEAVVQSEMPRKLKEPDKCWENNQWSDNDDCEPSTGKPMPRK